MSKTLFFLVMLLFIQTSSLARAETLPPGLQAVANEYLRHKGDVRAGRGFDSLQDEEKAIVQRIFERKIERAEELALRKQLSQRAVISLGPKMTTKETDETKPKPSDNSMERAIEVINAALDAEGYDEEEISEQDVNIVERLNEAAETLKKLDPEKAEKYKAEKIARVFSDHYISAQRAWSRGSFEEARNYAAAATRVLFFAYALPVFTKDAPVTHEARVDAVHSQVAKLSGGAGALGLYLVSNVPSEISWHTLFSYQGLAAAAMVALLAIQAPAVKDFVAETVAARFPKLAEAFIEKGEATVAFIHDFWAYVAKQNKWKNLSGKQKGLARKTGSPEMEFEVDEDTGDFDSEQVDEVHQEVLEHLAKLSSQSTVADLLSETLKKKNSKILSCPYRMQQL